VLVTVPAA
jgi:hypothetical protein